MELKGFINSLTYNGFLFDLFIFILSQTKLNQVIEEKIGLTD